ncbi:MAG: hypothetical protein ABIZ80_05825 [Bryobacteraceae bacterium]
MTDQDEFITVFRSADPTAEEDATQARDRLVEQGIPTKLLGDEEPEIIVGTYEVRVPASEQARAEEILATPAFQEAEENEEDIAPEGLSHDLDPVTLFSSQNLDAEMEAISIRSILEANGIPAVIVGASQIPSLPFEVQVPKSRMEEALALIAEARATADATQASEDEADPA